MNGSLLTSLDTIGSATTATVIALIITCVALVCYIAHLNVYQLVMNFTRWLMRVFSKLINKAETSYRRDIEIGKIDETRRTVKFYRFLNDLIIDLGLKQQGATPYEFLFIVGVLTFFGDILVCQLLFGGIFIAFIMYPIALAGVVCVLYTKANVAHDRRIEAIIEAENIICNNISGGVLVAVKGTINVMPVEVKGEFRDFIDNIESKNYHIRTALMELNSNLGSVADDFIKKCIMFETEEEHGIVGIFRDVVEVNNIKSEMRTEMKRRFEEVTNSFIMGASMIFVFLIGVLAIYPDVRSFYLTTTIGQVIIALDMLLLIIEFVYITYLRAQEL